MALFAPSQSPAVVVKEVYLTGGVPNVQTSTGAYVGKFKWGPVDKATLVANEEELVGTFGSPDTSHNIISMTQRISCVIQTLFNLSEL